MAALMSAHHLLHSAAEQHSHGGQPLCARVTLCTTPSHAQQCRRTSGRPAACAAATTISSSSSHHHHELGASPPQQQHQHHQPLTPASPPLERRNSGGTHWALQAALATSSAAAAAPPQATSLGWSAGFAASFRLGEVVGRGSFATVHRAVHRASGAAYAVKVLPKRRCPQQLESIRREAGVWATAAAACRYVARLEGLFEDEEAAYIVQELCSGGSLKDLLRARGGALGEGEARDVMAGLLDLLAECHKAGIVHGDVKPANLLFSSDGSSSDGSGSSSQPLRVRAVDFGCSQHAQGRPLFNKACGSPLYMAAEVALQRYGVGADVWSAGVMLYQMLTGRLPFWMHKTLEQVASLPAWEVVAGVRTHEIAFPPSLWAGISPDARDLVARMLQRDPAARITAADALRHPWLAAAQVQAAATSQPPAPPANNAVPLSRDSPLRPLPLLNTSSGSDGMAPSSPGPLSPARPSPLRSVLSGERPLASSALVAGLHRQPSLPEPARAVTQQ